MIKPYSIRIFCKKQLQISTEWLNDFFKDRMFFEEEPKLLQRGNMLELHYKVGKNPVCISLHGKGDSYFEKETREINDILSISRNSKGKDIVSALLSETCNLILLEFQREEFEEEEEVWEFLDVFEAWVATECEGFVHTDDEIFYDKRLKKIYKL